ncbi:MAG: hypothetical protein XD78_1495 [Desulfotomaculum sp. 46_296]|nr:MAG: hypothetical protein XD78_1495 [Desulfotomaculum sp. 46_296]
MKKFKGVKSHDEIIAAAKQGGWEVDTHDYDTKGSDFIWLSDMDNRMLQIRVSTFNGHFAVWRPASERPIATHLSSQFDDEPWYAEILDLIYESAGGKNND